MEAERIAKTLIQIMESSLSLPYIGEPISQLEHALQCADLALKQAPQDEELILSAFFHDLGHICPMDTARETMGALGVHKHEAVGANYLKGLGFSEKIQELIKGHVEAKRYLTYTNPAYLEKLSEASLQTLTYQGGPMTSEEAKRFREGWLYREKLALRSWDEQAKVQSHPTSSLDFYYQMILRHLRRFN